LKARPYGNSWYTMASLGMTSHLRHKPPFPAVPNKSLDTEGTEDEHNKSITAELNQKTIKKVVPYTFSNVKSSLGYQKQHIYILD